MKYQIEVKIKVGPNEYEWKALRPSRGEPYVFETREKAEDTRRMCYEPWDDGVRVVEIKENISKTY